MGGRADPLDREHVISAFPKHCLAAVSAAGCLPRLCRTVESGAAGLQARGLPDVCANKWQALPCNYTAAERSQEIILSAGFGTQGN